MSEGIADSLLELFNTMNTEEVYKFCDGIINTVPCPSTHMTTSIRYMITQIRKLSLDDYMFAAFYCLATERLCWKKLEGWASIPQLQLLNRIIGQMFRCFVLNIQVDGKRITYVQDHIGMTAGEISAHIRWEYQST